MCVANISRCLALLLLLLSASCGVPESAVMSQQGRASDGISQKKAMILRQLEAGAYIDALAAIRGEMAGGAAGNDLRREYLQALNGAIAQGEVQLKANKPGQAGRLFRAARDSFPAAGELASRIDMTAPELEAMIDRCADAIMENGLVAYRAGNLNDAITVWKQALAFHPRHQAIQNAIQTADTQLKNLQGITGEP